MIRKDDGLVNQVVKPNQFTPQFVRFDQLLELSFAVGARRDQDFCTGLSNLFSFGSPADTHAVWPNLINSNGAATAAAAGQDRGHDTE